MNPVFFPFMHAELIPPGLPGEIRLLDPGVLPPAETSSRHWRPEGLPLGREQAMKFLSESLDFGERFQRPSELHYFTAAELEDYYSQTSMSIRSEFMRSADMNSDFSRVDDQGHLHRLQAQMTLLLAWKLEESLGEYRELQQGISEGWTRFRRDIGLEEDEGSGIVSMDSLQAEAGSPSNDPMSWRPLLIWFLYFLQQGDSLVLCDGRIIAEWEEIGLSLRGPSDEECTAFGLTGSQRQSYDIFVLKAPGWHLALLDGPDPTKPWLQNDRFAVYLRRH